MPNTFVFKVVLLGDTQAGKTALSNCILGKEFSENYTATIGADFATKKLESQQSTIELWIWETAGHVRYKRLLPVYCREKNLFIYVVDTTKSIDNLSQKIVSDFNILDSEDFSNIPLFLVGSKRDIAEAEGIDVDVLLANLVDQVKQRSNQKICFKKQYATSAKTPLDSNQDVISLLKDIWQEAQALQDAKALEALKTLRLLEEETASGSELLPMWWNNAHKTLQLSISSLSKSKKKSINDMVAQLKAAVLSEDNSESEKSDAVLAFTSQCNNILEVKHPAAKKAVYAFALTVLCALIGLSIPLSLGISGIAILAASAVAGSALGASIGVLSKNSLFKQPACLVDVATFADTIKNEAAPTI